MAAAQRSRTSEPAADWMTRDAGQGGRGARPADAPPLRPLPLASRVRTRATRWLSRFDRTQEVHQFGDSVMSFDWVAKRQVCLDLIMTATSHTVAHQIAVSDQAADNALCRAFCDAHDLSDVAQPQFGIARDGELAMESRTWAWFVRNVHRPLRSEDCCMPLARSVLRDSRDADYFSLIRCTHASRHAIGSGGDVPGRSHGASPRALVLGRMRSTSLA